MTAKRNCKKRRTFRSVASSISSAQVPQNPILIRLLGILGRLPLTKQIDGNNFDVISRYLSIKFNEEKVELISLEDVYHLSDVMFTELNKTFENLFSALCKQKAETCPKFVGEGESIELATLLLRCCVKILALLLHKQEVPLEKAKTLLTILSRLIRASEEGCSIVIKHDGPLDPRRTFLCSWLEVFIDEILMKKSIKDLLYQVDSAFSLCRLFTKHDRASVVEMVSAHFLISTSDEKMNQMCVERLYWKDVDIAFRTPQVSLCAATRLLLNPLMFSAPKMFNAHVVLLVSGAIGICSPPSVKGSDFQLIDRYICAFEKSVFLYTKHMMRRSEDEPPVVKFGASKSNSRVAFEQLVLPSTLAKINDVTLKLKDSCDLYQRNNAKRENNEVVAYSVAYAKASLCVLDSSCLENMLSQCLSVLGCVILRASSDDVMDTVLQEYNGSSTEDLYLLAATLKLMSCSMLQTIHILRNWQKYEVVGDVRARKEYKSMMHIVQRFEMFSVHLPGQSLLRDGLESHPHGHLKSMWMLMHFSGLLSVSFALKLDILVKGSIFGMVVSLYLFILEGGDLAALGNSIFHSEIPTSSIPSSGSKDLARSGKAEETNRKMCKAVALKFRKTRTFYLGKMSKAEDSENGSDSGVIVEGETCNGESFLWCMADSSNMKSSDVEDLADFIACEPGKDYSDWLKGKERFRGQKWKWKKIARQRWNKKLKAWRENRRNIV
ncbi:unnamed protein product [Cochlearia groenlandica]